MSTSLRIIVGEIFKGCCDEIEDLRDSSIKFNIEVIGTCLQLSLEDDTTLFGMGGVMQRTRLDGFDGW